MQKVVDGLSSGKDKTAANINPSTVIVMAGIAKVFVGELIEEAKAVQESRGDAVADAPLTPFHIIEAYRRLGNNPALAPRSSNCKKNRIL